MEDWKEYKLGEISNITKLAGFEFSKYIKYNDTGEIIALRALNLRNGRLDLTEIKRIDRSVSDSLPRSKLYKGEILFTYTGNGYGDCALVDANDKYHLAPNICKISPDNKTIDSNFLFQTIRSDFFYKQVSNYIGGSSQPTIPMETIRQLKVIIPPLATQQKIAQILSSLDDKIELNNKINANLEQQAQALFKSWFVDFEPFGGEMPAGWKVGKLSDVINIKYGKDHKKLEDGIIPVYGSGGIMRYVKKPIYNRESVLIPRKGTLNNVFYIDEPFWSVDTMFYTEMKEENLAKYVYFFVKAKDLASMNAGSAVPSMTTEILNALELVIPNKEYLSKFETVVSPMFKQMKHCEIENKKLSTLRDTLLPKLMSGDLKVD